MPITYHLMMPHAVYSGENAIENLENILRQNCIEHALLFTDKGIRKSGLLDIVIKEVQKADVRYDILDELPPEPDYQTVQKLAEQARDFQSGLIIACGGGSVMDAAKLAAVLATNAYQMQDLMKEPQMAGKQLPTVMIPTTAGTGAEVTPNAIVSIPEKEIKFGIVHESMIADYVILDVRMVQNLPRNIAAATGVDALAHCLECFTGKKANPFSDMFALEGLDLILNHIENACDNPDAVADKNCMQLAAFYGGLAITASGTTAVHALSYPLGGKYHIAHGVANAILLTPVMRFNEPVCRERMAAVYDRCCHDVKKNRQTLQEKSEWVLERLQEIVRHLDIPCSLRKLGVPESDLEALVHAGLQTRRLLDNNPRTVTEQDARRIYQGVM